MPAGDNETVAAAGAERLESGESAGRSVKSRSSSPVQTRVPLWLRATWSRSGE